MSLRMYIVLEGIVGTGKSTQAQKLYDYLSTKYPAKDICLTREPGGTEIAESIRTLVQGTDFDETMHPITEAYLYAAARAQLIASTIKPCLDNGGIVISDRCVWSTLVIQGHVKGLGIETALGINTIALQNCMPDLFLFFDLDLDIALSRTSDSDGDKHEREGRAFYDKQYEGYTSLLSHPLFEQISHRIDAQGSVDETRSRVKEVIDQHI